MLCAHRLQRVVSLGGLAAQHDAVIAVQHSIGHIAGLSTSGTRLLGHALQHLRESKRGRFTLCAQTLQEKDLFVSTDLSGADDGLSDPVAAAGHHLLSDEDLLCWDFNAQVTTGDHDTVASLQDLVKSIGQQDHGVKMIPV